MTAAPAEVTPQRSRRLWQFSLRTFLVASLVASLLTVWATRKFILDEPPPVDPQSQVVPVDWQVGEFHRRTGEWISKDSKNIRWVAALGSQTYGWPVVSDGKIFIGTNNSYGYLKRYPSQVDLGVLLCFRQRDGKFLWQHSNEKLQIGRVQDWPLQGICSRPWVEGNRLWYVTNRCEVVCLDTEGFKDGQDDGPALASWGRLFDELKSEFNEVDHFTPAVAALKQGRLTAYLRKQFADRGMPLAQNGIKIKSGASPNSWQFFASVNGKMRQFRITTTKSKLSAFKMITTADTNEADEIWKLDMIGTLGVSPHNMSNCHVIAVGQRLFVCTSNGVDESHVNLPKPNAPSFICLDKNTGALLWSDNSPGKNILHGQWGSPAYGVLGGVPQVLFPGGDGWLYSFDPAGTAQGKSKLLWKFDCNPKTSKWIMGGRGTRNNVVAAPVLHEDRVYIAVGQDPEHGEGNGHLWCVDPTRRGDVSAELVFNAADPSKPIPHKKMQACVAADGDFVRPNPNSAVIWQYTGSKTDMNNDGKIGYEEELHRSITNVAIKDDLLFAADFSGLLHCVDADTGKAHWTYDLLAASWSTPRIFGDHVYVCDEDGDVAIFRLSADPTIAMILGSPIQEIYMQNSVYSTPTAADNILYFANKDRLFAIEQGAKPVARKSP